jgi:hypothetical protein
MFTVVKILVDPRDELQPYNRHQFDVMPIRFEETFVASRT